MAPSVKRSNCYMVWGGDIVATSQRASRSMWTWRSAALWIWRWACCPFLSQREGTWHLLPGRSGLGTMTVASGSEVSGAVLLSSVWLASSPQHMELIYLRGQGHLGKQTRTKWLHFVQRGKDLIYWLIGNAWSFSSRWEGVSVCLGLRKASFNSIHISCERPHYLRCRRCEV